MKLDRVSKLYESRSRDIVIVVDHRRLKSRSCMLELVAVSPYFGGQIYIQLKKLPGKSSNTFSCNGKQDFPCSMAFATNLLPYLQILRKPSQEDLIPLLVGLLALLVLQVPSRTHPSMHLIPKPLHMLLNLERLFPLLHILS